MHSYKRVVSGAPNDLQLVARLQNALAKVIRTQLSAEPSLTVEEATESSLDALPFGASLILGGPAINPAAQPFLERISRARFRADFASNRYRGYPIVDTHTGRLFEPSFTPSGRANVELERDYGLLTIDRIKGVNPACEASLVISAMGVHAAGRRSPCRRRSPGHRWRCQLGTMACPMHGSGLPLLARLHTM
jgi:hypothetical protein